MELKPFIDEVTSRQPKPLEAGTELRNRKSGLKVFFLSIASLENGDGTVRTIFLLERFTS